MPRAAAPNSCKTCLARKIKCDGTLPVCNRCSKQGLFCDRSSSLTFRRYREPLIDSLSVENSPQTLLQHPDIAQLFHIYIKELAPWYDLNDVGHRSFGHIVPEAALTSPLLFAAVIAFAGTYAARKYKFPVSISEAYHSRCLQLLISLSADDETANDGVALAATCLLRSYEILSEKEDPNRHLFGASTLLPPTPRLSDRGLIPCGFWNYLREDITYSLVHQCCLKIQVGLLEDEPVDDDQRANAMTLILAALVNTYFAETPANVMPALERWKRKFAANPFSRCEDQPFPAVRMLKDSHVAAMHYYYVAICMLKPELRTASAVEICGLAMNAQSDSVIVNAYGPICFSCRWLTDGEQRLSLISWLKKTQAQTAWSVEILITKLQSSWKSSTTTTVAAP